MSSPSEGERSSTSTIQRLSLTFWRALTRGKAMIAQESLRGLSALKLKSSAFPFEDDFSMEIGTPIGTSSLLAVPADTPKNTREAFDKDKEVSLICLDPDVHCRGRVGTGSSALFFACALKTSGPGACSTAGHREMTSDRMFIQDSSWAIMAPSASGVTKPRCFSKPFLRRALLPSCITDREGEQILGSLTSLPSVWTIILLNYPGAAVIMDMFNEGDGPLEQLADDVSSLKPPSLTLELTEHVPHASDMPVRRSTRNIKLFRENFKEEDEDDDSLQEDEAPARPDDKRFAFQMSEEWSVNSSPSLPSKAASEQPNVNSMSEVYQLKQEIRKLKLLQDDRDKALGMEFKKFKLHYDNEVRTLQSQIASYQRYGSVTPLHHLSRLEKEEIVAGVITKLETSMKGYIDQELRIDSVITNMNNLTARLSNAESRAADLLREFQSPEGAIALVNERLQHLESGQVAGSVSFAGYVFKDANDVRAWVIVNKDESLYRFVVDMVIMILLCKDSFTDIETGLKMYAAADKAKFKDLMTAKIALSHSITYPENVIVRSKATSLSEKGSWQWNSDFSSAKLYDGDLRSGTHQELRTKLLNVRSMVQTAIDNEFPLDQKPKTNAILTDNLRRSTEQAVCWADSLIPFHRTLTKGGLTTQEAWDRALIMTKGVFETIQVLRAVSTEVSCANYIYGSFRCTAKLDEYVAHKFVEHPRVTSLLALTSMEREGKTIADAIEKLNEGRDKINTKALENRVKKLESDLKALKDKNPSLN